MIERLILFFINIFCPPVTVIILTGLSTDAIINTFLFIAGVIPGHIHGFYLSCTYFNRKRKVRKGKWPGPRPGFIYSRVVWNGGASDERVHALWEIEMEKRAVKERRRRGGSYGYGSSGIGREVSRRESRSDIGREMSRKQSKKSGRSGGSGRSRGSGGSESSWSKILDMI